MSYDDLHGYERALICVASSAGTFDGTLIRADSRVALEAALAELDESTLASWQQALASKASSPGERWAVDAQWLRTGPPAWALDCMTRDADYQRIGAWGMLQVGDTNPRTRLRLVHRHGEVWMARCEGIAVDQTAREACKSVLSGVRKAFPDDPSAFGLGLVLLGCGQRWRSALLAHSSSDVQGMAQIACRGRYASAAPQIKTAILALLEEDP